MKNYFLVVFGGGTFFQYRLNDIISNSFNGFVNDEFAFQGENYYFPVGIEGEEYFLEDNSSLWTFNVNGMPLKERIVLKAGDYITGNGPEGSLAFLLVDYSACALSSKIFRLQEGTVFLGREEGMNVVLDSSQSISRKHASIRFTGGTAILNDLSGNERVYVNGKLISGDFTLSSGDHIFIMGNSLIYYPGVLLIPANIVTHGLTAVDSLPAIEPDAAGHNFSVYSRTPRIFKSLATDEVKIDRPPAPTHTGELPFLLRVGPSLTMSFAMLASLGVTISNVLKGGGYSTLITSGVMCISMLLGALLWPKLLSDYNKRQEKAKEKYRRDRYGQYLAQTDESIKERYERNTRVWNETLFPAPKDLIDFAASRDHRLWERSNREADFLTVRLGTGDRPFEVAIKTDEKGFELYEDDLANGISEIQDKYRYLHKVPITLSLKDEKVTGVFGDYADVGRAMIVNLTTLYAPEELKIVLVYNHFQEEMMSPYTDLPHMWSSDRRVRYVATSETEVHSLFSTIDEVIESREEELGKDDVRSPHFVFMIFDEHLIAGDSFKKVLLDSDNTYGVSAVFFGETYSALPRECVAIVQKTAEECGVYRQSESDSHFVRFQADTVFSADRDRLSDALSRIQGRVEKSTSSVPESVSFLDVFQVGNVDALNIQSHWATNRSDKSLAAPIGVGAGGDRFYLDIHEKYHGCHGLVAGTTGSGKSEFLQAFILSLMINYSPKEVAFVLVDFKGGDMARPFLKSPHLAATISNLSGNILHRALVSLEAEVKSRQKCFNETASKLGIDKLDINSYQRYFKEGKVDRPLPHLIIIIDEFAQLKTQHPEFMSKLIDVAQVGRSLGIHLILATQKPSGVVDPQIWSNSRFKVCLKVMDKQDSMDMINHPVAAMIKQPGRAYVQVGYDEIFEQIQSGFSGADYVPKEEFVNDDSITVNMIDSAGNVLRKARDEQKGESTSQTQLEAVMQEVAALGEAGHLQTKQLWLPPLPEELRYEDVEKTYSAFVSGRTDPDTVGQMQAGLLDLIQIQQQVPFSIDFLRDGNYAVYGASGTGKSTFVQTVVYGLSVKYTPEKFKTFFMDFNGGSLFNLTKDPHCMYYVDDTDEKKVTKAIGALASIIRDRQQVFTEHDCANYKSYLKTGADPMPMILLVIDNYAALHQKMYNAEDRLMQIIASAARSGIYMILTGNSKGAIYYKALDQISRRIVFTMNDADAYRDILGSRTPISPEGIKGRALTVYEKNIIELQIAVPFDCEDEAGRIARMNAAFASMTSVYGAPDFSMQDQKMEDDDPFAYDDEPMFSTYQKAEVPAVEDLSDEAGALVLGIDSKTGGKKGLLLKNRETVFIDNRLNSTDVLPGLIKATEESGASLHLISSKADSPYRVGELDAFLLDYAEGEVEDKEKDVLIIDGFSDFFDRVSDEALDALISCIQQGKAGTILTIDDMSRIRDYMYTSQYKPLVRCEVSIIVGGDANSDECNYLNDKFYQVDSEFREKVLSGGEGILFRGDHASYIELPGR